MNFLNIGFPEIFLFIVILLIVFGPEKMQENAKSAARFFRNVKQSSAWNQFFHFYQTAKSYPSELMKEVEFEEVQSSFRKKDGADDDSRPLV